MRNSAPRITNDPRFATPGAGRIVKEQMHAQSIQSWLNLFQRALYPHNTQGISRPFARCAELRRKPRREALFGRALERSEEIGKMPDFWSPAFRRSLQAFRLKPGLQPTHFFRTLLAPSQPPEPGHDPRQFAQRMEVPARHLLPADRHFHHAQAEPLGQHEKLQVEQVAGFREGRK